MIGGNFSNIQGTAINGIARLNADGTLDTGFSPTVNNQVYAISIQSNGKIIIGGSFSSVSGVNRSNVARLNADGTLDSSFNASTTNNVWPNTGWVWSIAVQSDGKILLGGDFENYNGVSINRITRINVNGTLDTSFTPPSFSIISIWSIALQSDGKVLVGGV